MQVQVLCPRPKYEVSYDNVVLRYRIGILNDFHDTKSVVDFQKYGETQILDAYEVGGLNHRGYQVREDAIHIFLNFKLIAAVKSKSEAVSVLNKLIASCPPESKSDFDEYKEYLFRRLK